MKPYLLLMGLSLKKCGVRYRRQVWVWGKYEDRAKKVGRKLYPDLIVLQITAAECPDGQDVTNRCESCPHGRTHEFWHGACRRKGVDMTKARKLYPVAIVSIYFPAAPEMLAVRKQFPGARYQDVRVKPLGEFRPPKKGEWYLSGAKPEGYVALNDLSTSYHIGELVRIKTVTVEVEV